MLTFSYLKKVYMQKLKNFKPDVLFHICNASSHEAGAHGLLEFETNMLMQWNYVFKKIPNNMK